MTAQMAEKLHYEGEELQLCTEPLAQYFDLAGIEPPRGSCSALRRGYVGSWEITGDRLYLLGLKRPFSRVVIDGMGLEQYRKLHPELAGIHPKDSMENLFPEHPERVFAHWYSGTLRAPKGKRLKYVHGGYASTYEQDLLIAVEKGVVTGTKVRHNGVAEDPDALEGYGPAAMTLFPPAGGERGEGEGV